MVVSPSHISSLPKHSLKALFRMFCCFYFVWSEFALGPWPSAFGFACELKFLVCQLILGEDSLSQSLLVSSSLWPEALTWSRRGPWPRGSHPSSAPFWAEAASAFSPLPGALWSPPSNRSQLLAGATCFGPPNPVGQPLSPFSALSTPQTWILSDVHVVSSTLSSYISSLYLSSVTGGSHTCAWRWAFRVQTDNTVLTEASGRVSHVS